MTDRKTITVNEKIFDDLEELKQFLKKSSWNSFFKSIMKIVYKKHEKAKRRKGKPSLPTLRPIITQYPGYCNSCKADLPIGSRAYYGKQNGKTILLCLACQVDAMGDRGIAKKYRTMRELKNITTELRKEANNLSDQINQSKFLPRFTEIVSKLDTIILKTEDYYEHVATSKEKQTLENLNNFFRRTKRNIEEFMLAVKTQYKEIPTPLTQSPTHEVPYLKKTIPTPNPQPNKKENQSSGSFVHCLMDDKKVKKTFCEQLCKIEDFNKWRACQELKLKKKEA